MRLDVKVSALAVSMDGRVGWIGGYAREAGRAELGICHAALSVFAVRRSHLLTLRSANSSLGANE